MGRLSYVLSLLEGNPAALGKIVAGEIHSRFRTRRPHVTRKIGGIKFDYDFLIDPFVADMHFGTYEPAIVAVIRKILKKGGTFIDVGANIGYITAIAAAAVGKTGRVHSFEPVPQFYSRLEMLARSNPGYYIYPNRCAVGENRGKGTIDVTNLRNIGWNTMVPGFMRDDTRKERIDVDVISLSDYFESRAIEDVSLIKIDTEGYEFPVLKGLARYFSSTTRRPPIICEICPAVCALLGYPIEDIDSFMKMAGYRAMEVANPAKRCSVQRLNTTTDVLFLR